MDTWTFFFTDIENSTPLRERLPEPYRATRERHFDILRAAIAKHGGDVFSLTGDGLHAVFDGDAVNSALECATECQRALRMESGPISSDEFRVRIGLHRGEAERLPGDFDGIGMHLAARVLDAGHGAQIICSPEIWNAIGDDIRGSLRDLGLYRLKGFKAPVRLFQADYEGMPAAGFPPLNSPPAFTHRLPAPPTCFFGRESELGDLSALLAPEMPGRIQRQHGRLVTILGPGGTGKTRLSLKVAEVLQPAYSHAVWFIPLAELRDGSLLPEALREGLGIPPEPTASTLERVIEFLAAQTSLLLLDNLEQIVPDCAGIVQQMIERVPTLAVLATSRVRLDLRAEQEFAIAPLPVPIEGGDARHFPVCASVQLFVDRARAARREFALSSENSRDVAKVCSTLEGIPLAIEIAAARSGILTPGQMLSRLEHRLDFLVGGKRDLPVRHRTLRAAVEWSYTLLAEPLQRLFARLSVFRGGWTLEAAEAVAGADPEMLGELHGSSLVVTDEVGGTMRFRMLEVIREFAAEQLTQAELDEVSAGHHRFFANLAVRPWDADEARTLRELNAEHDNLRAMLGGSGPLRERIAAAVRLHRFWLIRGHLREGRDWLTRFADADPDLRARAETRHAAGILACTAGDYEDGRDRLLEALALYEELGDERNVGAILNSLGLSSGEQCDFVDAAGFLERSLAIFRRIGALAETATVLSNIGQNAVRLHDLPAALAALNESLTLQRSTGTQFMVAHALENLADFHLASADFAAARGALAECIAIRESLGTRHNAANTLAILAEIALGEGEVQIATRLFGAAIATLSDGGTLASPALLKRLAGSGTRLAEAVGAGQFAQLSAAGGNLRIESVLSPDGGWKMDLTATSGDPVISDP